MGKTFERIIESRGHTDSLITPSLNISMAQISRTQLVGHLTKDELFAVLPANTFTKTGQCMTWSNILEVLRAQSSEILSIVQRAKEGKEVKLLQKQAKKRQKKCQFLAARRQDEGGSKMAHDDANVEETIQERMREQEITSGSRDVGETGSTYTKYLELPTDAEVKDCFWAFREATSNAALTMDVCVVCAREFAHSEGKEHVCQVDRSLTMICEREYSFFTWCS